MTTPFQLRGQLACVSVVIAYRGWMLTVPHVMIDTGSGGTVFDQRVVARLGIKPAVDEKYHAMVGIGALHGVYYRHLDRLELDGVDLIAPRVQIGDLSETNYNGILGLDILRHANALLDFAAMSIQVRTELDSSP